MDWTDALYDLPLIAILRGIRPAEVSDVTNVLWESGFRVLEVPLNSPQPLESIARMRSILDGKALVGAGTVLDRDSVVQASSAGAQLIVSPNTNPDVIAASKDLGLLSLPAFVTPSEAFSALKAGADALKLYPAEASSPKALRAMLAVLPVATHVFPVGGIEAANMRSWLAAGAVGFGIGSSLYRPGKSIDAIRSSAQAFIAAWKERPSSRAD